MTEKNTLNQERIMKIIKAATQIATTYQKIAQQVEAYRKSEQDSIPLYILHDIRPPFEALTLIASEKAHFEARWEINRRARKGMRDLYARRTGTTIQAEESKSLIDFALDFDDQELATTKEQNLATSIVEPTLFDCYNTILDKFPNVSIAWQGDILQELQLAYPQLSPDQIIALFTKMTKEPKEKPYLIIAQTVPQGTRVMIQTS